MYHVWFALALRKKELVDVQRTCQKSFEEKIMNFDDISGIPEQYQNVLEFDHLLGDSIILKTVVFDSKYELDSAIHAFEVNGWKIGEETNRDSIHAHRNMLANWLKTYHSEERF